MREIVSNIRDDVDNLRKNSVSKFLFYNFNTFRVSDGLEPLPLRHFQIAEDEFALKKLQNIACPQFIETLIAYSNENIEYDQIQGAEKRNIVDRILKELKKCKKEYNSAFINVGKHFKETLRNAHPEDLRRIEEDLKSLLYYDGNILDIPDSMVITVTKMTFHKNPPKEIYYRDYKKFDQDLVREELYGCDSCYDTFEEIFINVLNKHAPLKKNF